MDNSTEEFSQPSTSKTTIKTEEHTPLRNSEDGSDALPPMVKDEEAEIARLETERKTNVDAAPDKGDCEPRIQFQCCSCEMTEFVHYFGKKPDFAHGIQFFEGTYVMRDPFKPPPPRWKPKSEYFIVIGAHCSTCNASVCQDAECSFYYTRTFCLNCAEKELKSLPPEAQLKLRKQLQAKQIKNK